MNWDLRHTRAPVIAQGNIDMFMMGELFHLHSSKTAVGSCPYKPEAMTFAEPQGGRLTNSQLVISEVMASCSLDALFQSPIGNLHLSTDRLNRMFEMFPNLP